MSVDLREHTIVDASREAPSNRGFQVEFAAGAAATSGTSLRLDGGNWAIRAAMVNADGTVRTAAVTGSVLLRMRTSCGAITLVEDVTVPIHGALFSRAADALQVEARCTALGAAVLLAVQARKLTGPLTLRSVSSQILPAPGGIMPIPAFSTTLQLLAAAGSTVQYLDAAGNPIGGACVVPASGVLETRVPGFAFAAQFVNAAAAGLEWLGMS